MTNKSETPANNDDVSKAQQNIMLGAGGVMEYADVKAGAPNDPRLQEILDLMESYMEQIDEDPSNFDNIINYGNPPLVQLGNVSQGMIKVQGTFAKQVNVMKDALDKMEGGIKGLGLDKLGSKGAEFLKLLSSGAGKSVKGLAKIWDKVSGAEAKRTEGEKFIKQMQEDIPGLYLEMTKLVDDIGNTETGLQQVEREAMKLGEARMECNRQLAIYLGAASEVMRRYDEVYIPEAEEDHAKMKTPETEQYLDEVRQRRDDFARHRNTLEGSRLQCISAAQQIRQILDTMRKQRIKVREIKINGKQEWTAMLAGVGFAGSSLKAGELLQKADSFGDKMHDQGMSMIERAHDMTLAQNSRGTVDPQKLIESANRLTQMIEKEKDAYVAEMKRLDEVNKKLRETGDNLLASVQGEKVERMLEASKKVEEKERQEQLDAATTVTETPAAAPAVNDNAAAADKPAAPAAEKPVSRRKRPPSAPGA